MTKWCLVWLMVFSATFNNISVISWRSALLVEECPEKPPTCRRSLTNLSHNGVSGTPHLSGIRTHNVSDDMH